MGWIDANWILGLGPAATRLAQTALAFAATPQGTLVLAAGGEPLTITVVAPSAFSGSTVFAPSDLSTGPVWIRPPELVGPATVGQAVSVQPAIWAYDGTGDVPSRSWQWRANGADIPGATGVSYTPVSGQAGAELSVVETASDAFGARSTASAEWTVAA